MASLDWDGKPHFFTVSEAAHIVNATPWMLRSWERRLGLRVRRSRGKHRVYSRADVEFFAGVHHMMHAEGYTMAGVMKKMGGVSLAT